MHVIFDENGLPTNLAEDPKGERAVVRKYEGDKPSSFQRRLNLIRKFFNRPLVDRVLVETMVVENGELIGVWRRK